MNDRQHMKKHRRVCGRLLLSGAVLWGLLVAPSLTGEPIHKETKKNAPENVRNLKTQPELVDDTALREQYEQEQRRRLEREQFDELDAEAQRVRSSRELLPDGVPKLSAFYHGIIWAIDVPGLSQTPPPQGAVGLVNF